MMESTKRQHAVVKEFSALTSDEIGAWKEFQASNPANSSPYFTYGYIHCVEAVRPGVKVLCIRSASACPIAFLPFRVSVTGVARPADGLLSDLHGLISAPEESFDLPEALREAGLPGYVFSSVPYQHAAHDCYGQGSEGNPVVDLSDGFHRYVSERSAASKNFKRNLKKIEAIAAKHQVEVFHDQFDLSAFERMIELKRDRLRRTGKYDIFNDSWTRNLLERLLEADFEDVRGGFSYMLLDGELAAMFYYMTTPTALHYWFPAYEEKFSDLLIGHLMTFRTVEWAASLGIKEYQLGPGQDNHKRMMASYYAPIRQGYVATSPLHQLAGRFSSWRFGNDPVAVRRFCTKLTRKFDRVMVSGRLRA